MLVDEKEGDGETRLFFFLAGLWSCGGEGCLESGVVVPGVLVSRQRSITQGDWCGQREDADFMA